MPSSYAVGEHFERFIKQQVERGRYSTASEVIRDALRLLEEEEAMREAKLEALRADIREGLDSGAGKPAEAVLSRLERKYAKMPHVKRPRR